MTSPRELPIGAKVVCPDCGRACVVGGRPREGERPLTHSARSDGRCATCALAVWMRATPPLASLVAEQGGAAFRLPHVREQVMRLMAVGGAPVEAREELDWPALIERLDLTRAKEDDHADEAP